MTRQDLFGVMFFRFWPSIFRESRQGAPLFYFKAENLVLRARSESVGFAEIVNTDRMVGTKAFMPFRVQRHRVKTKRLSLIIS